MRATIFVTDDEPAIRSALVKRLSRRQHTVAGFESGDALLKGLDREAPDLILLDLKMPGLSGLDTLKAIRSKFPQVLIIMLTAYGTVEDAVEAMKLGAYDFVIKTVDLNGLDQVVGRALELLALRRRVTYEAERQGDEFSMGRLIAESASMQALVGQIRELAQNPKTTVLLLGETGTGKEFIARVLHHNGLRAAAPFIGVNCTAIPRELFESELFGYERGAFTGAHHRKLGVLDRAESGTLFLDEIGDLDLAMQAKLLRVLQERKFQRVGGTEEIAADFRLIAATNRDLKKEIVKGYVPGGSLFSSERRVVRIAASAEQSGGYFPAQHEGLDAVRQGIWEGYRGDRCRCPRDSRTLCLPGQHPRAAKYHGAGDHILPRTNAHHRLSSARIARSQLTDRRGYHAGRSAVYPSRHDAWETNLG